MYLFVLFSTSMKTLCLLLSFNAYSIRAVFCSFGLQLNKMKKKIKKTTYDEYPIIDFQEFFLFHRFSF